MVEVVYQKGDWSKYSGRGDITKVTVASDVDEIASNAFWCCCKLKEIEIKAKTVGNSSFLECKDLVKVVLKEGVTSVGTCAFQGCHKISTFIWPDSVKKVGRDVFEGCDKLHEVRTIHNTT